MGEPAGRSSKNPTAAGAVGRSTPRQRLYVVPPPHEEWATVTPREIYLKRSARVMVVCLVLAVTGSIVVILTGSWWLQMIGLLELWAAIVVAGVSRPWRYIRQDLVIEDRKTPRG